MNPFRCILAQPLLPGLLILSALSGCATSPRPGARVPTDHAYISYHAPAEGSGRLRLAIKDLIDMKGEVTSAGSEFLAKHSKPAERDAACLAIARERHLPIVGKTNLTELAVGVSGLNRYYGTPRNPLSPRRHLIPGGSSSGSAVAVANGSADVAFGTDTAGSIRVPAACCGIAGLKTTFGLIPLDGIYPISPDKLDTVGPMARDVAGLVQGMDLLERGFAGKYRRVGATQQASRIKVGRLYLSGTAPKVDQAVDEALIKAGVQVVVLGNEFRDLWNQADRDGRTVAAAGAWVNNQKFKDESQVEFRTKAVVALGSFEFRNNYRAALQRRKEWQAALRRLFEKVDFLALPTLQALPPRVPLFFGGTPAFEARVLGLQNTEAVNLAGNPALALPIPIHDRSIPVTSLQLVGPLRSEAALLQVGRLVEGKP